MRKTVFLFFILICLTSFGQISVNKKIQSELVGEFKYMGSTYIECNKYPNEGGDDYYVFNFRNSEYTQINDWQSFGFYDIDNAFENFSNMCLDGFNNVPDDNYFSLTLPDGQLMVKYTKSTGVLMMYFVYIKNGITSQTSWMTKKQVLKLFGKSKKKKRK